MSFNLIKTKLLTVLGYKKCHFCETLTKQEVRIPIDTEPEHDGDIWYMTIVYDTVRLCKQHLKAFQNNELYNN
jgi:hypothetical protein